MSLLRDLFNLLFRERLAIALSLPDHRVPNRVPYQVVDHCPDHPVKAAGSGEAADDTGQCDPYEAVVVELGEPRGAAVLAGEGGHHRPVFRDDPLGDAKHRQ
eukprot:236198_1